VRLELRSPTYWSDLWLGEPAALLALRKAPLRQVKHALEDGRALVLPRLDGVGSKTVVAYIDEQPPAPLTQKISEWHEGELLLDGEKLALAPARRSPETRAQGSVPAGRYTTRVGEITLDAAGRRQRLAELAGEGTVATVERHRRRIELAGVVLGLVAAVIMVLLFRWWAVVAGPAVGFAVMRIVMNRAARGMGDHPAWQKLAEAERALGREWPDVVVILRRHAT
jgi:hypothetical protein